MQRSQAAQQLFFALFADRQSGIRKIWRQVVHEEAELALELRLWMPAWARVAATVASQIASLPGEDRSSGVCLTGDPTSTAVG